MSATWHIGFHHDPESIRRISTVRTTRTERTVQRRWGAGNSVGIVDWGTDISSDCHYIFTSRMESSQEPALVLVDRGSLVIGFFKVQAYQIWHWWARQATLFAGGGPYASPNSSPHRFKVFEALLSSISLPFLFVSCLLRCSSRLNWEPLHRFRGLSSFSPFAGNLCYSVAPSDSAAALSLPRWSERRRCWQSEF